MDELKADYKKGLVVAISFCVFVMPLLLPKEEDIIERNTPEKEQNGDLKPEETANILEKLSTEPNELEIHLDHQDSVDHGNGQIATNNDDEADGSVTFDKPFASSALFPNFAKERLIDGLKEVLEEQTKSSMYRASSMDDQTDL